MTPREVHRATRTSTARRGSTRGANETSDAVPSHAPKWLAKLIIVRSRPASTSARNVTGPAWVITPPMAPTSICSAHRADSVSPADWIVAAPRLAPATSNCPAT
jgi:hypothetical protein